MSEFWARAVSALSGVALVGTTFLLGKLVRNRLAGALAALVLLTSPQFVRQARFGTADVLLTLFIYLAIFAYWLFVERSPNFWYSVCLFCGLALMAKGAGGLVAPGVIGVLALRDGRLRSMVKTRYFWGGIALALLIASPWHVLMFAMYGHEFIKNYFLYHVVERAATAIEGHAHTRWYYIEVLREGFFPWVYLAFMSLALGIREAIRGGKKIQSLLMLIVVVFGSYTLVQTRLPWYILPIYPALAILVGWMLSQAIESYDSIAFSSLLFGVFLLSLGESKKLALIACAAVLLLLGAAFLRLKKGPLQIVSAVAILTFLLGGIRQLRPLYQQADSSVAKLSRLATSGISPDHAPALIVLADVVPSATYYSDRPAVRMKSVESLREMNDSGPMQVILSSKDLIEVSSFFQTKVLVKDGPFVLVVVQRARPL